MKNGLVILVLCLCLTGCRAQETFETVADPVVMPVSAKVRQILVQLPEEAAVPATQSEAGTLYQCDGYEIILQTLDAGDLDATIRTVSGYSKDHVTLLKTRSGDCRRYDFVWSSAGEKGDRLGRAAVLDDGSHHYVLCVLADAKRMVGIQETVKQMFSGFGLV